MKKAIKKNPTENCINSRDTLTLTVHPGFNGPSLIVSKTFAPDVFTPGRSVVMTKDGFRTFQLFMLHLLQTINREPGLRFGNLVRANDPLIKVLYFLYGHIARMVAPLLSEHEQLDRTALALYPGNVTIPVSYYQTLRKPLKGNPGFDVGYFKPETWNTPGRLFFDVSVSQRINALLHSLLNASLNANLESVVFITTKTSPEKLSILLSTETTAIIDHLKHLNIQRSGTSLQMALYSHDEELFAYLAKHMNSAEVQRQCKEVFDHYEVADYDELMRKLAADAKDLCHEFETTVTEDSVNRFKNNLEDYVKNKPVHNPYILQRLYEIYETLPGDYNQDRLFSKKAIGLAQALSSARWLQHFVQGIVWLSESCELAQGIVVWLAPATSGELGRRRSFVCRRSYLPVDDDDARSLVPGRLGVDSFIEIFHGILSGNVRERRGRSERPFFLGSMRWSDAAPECCSKLLLSKNSEFKKFMRPASERQCVVQ